MNIKLGEAARELRKMLSLTQRDAADSLGISAVHLCNIEKGKSVPSPSLLARYKDLWEIDLYVFAWCRYGDVEKLPRPMQKAANDLSQGWHRRIKDVAARSQTKRST